MFSLASDQFENAFKFRGWKYHGSSNNFSHLIANIRLSRPNQNSIKMSEETVAAAAPAPVAAKKAAAKPKVAKKPAAHPPYGEMITKAIVALADKKGSSKIAIKKYILANFKIEDNKATNTQLNLALKRGVAGGKIVTAKGHVGHFKAVEAEKPKKAAVKKSPKKVVAKKPAAKKTPKKAAAKKPAAKKSPAKKAAASPAKKAAVKPAAAKKAPAKKAVKPKAAAIQKTPKVVKKTPKKAVKKPAAKKPAAKKAAPKKK